VKGASIDERQEVGQDDRMGCSDELLILADRDVEAAASHPFFAGLVRGDLPEATFRGFLEEDARFLVRWARNTALLASRCEDRALSSPLAAIGDGLPGALPILYAPMLEAYGSSLDRALGGKTNPLSEAYLRACSGYCADGTSLDGVAFTLGFFLHHKAVGDRVRARHPELPDTHYGRWVASWGTNPHFQQALVAICEAFNRNIEGASEDTREDAIRSFLLCSRFEVLYWDALGGAATPREPAFPSSLFHPL
jgi:thiaminase/transcriptional activator TenA